MKTGRQKAGRSPWRSLSLPARRRRALFLKFGAVVVLGLTIFIVFSWLLNSEAFTILSVEYEGLALADREAVSGAVMENLDGRFFGLVNKKTIFTLPWLAIEGELLALTPIIKDVSIKPLGLNEIKVTVVEREPVSLWCALSIAEDPLREECYFLDDSGFLFEKAPASSGAVYVRYFGNISTSTTPIGSRYLPESVFRELSFFLEAIARLGLNAERIFSEDRSGVTINLRGGNKLLISLTGDLHKTLRNLEVLLSREGKMGLERFLADLLYIDLRYGNKIYIKRR